MPYAKHQPSNIKHGGGIRPNVWVLTFGPSCSLRGPYQNSLEIDYIVVSDGGGGGCDIYQLLLVPW